MSTELDAPWGSFNVDIEYSVQDGDRHSPKMYEIASVSLEGNREIAERCLVDEYIFDAIKEDYAGRLK